MVVQTFLGPRAQLGGPAVLGVGHGLGAPQVKARLASTPTIDSTTPHGASVMKAPP